MSEPEFQQDLFAIVERESDVISRLCAALPKLPSVIRYYDEFEDKVQSIRNPTEQPKFELSIHGRHVTIDFSRHGTNQAFIFKHVFMFVLAQDISIVSAANYFSSLHHLLPSDVSAIVAAGPTGIGPVWVTLRARALPAATYLCAKNLLHLLCSYRLNGWSNDYSDYLSTALPLPSRDKYAGVRSGEVFLSSDEEATIVRHLDNVVERISQGPDAKIPHAEIVDAGMLLCSYQFAMRPIQISMLETRHVRIWEEISTQGRPYT